MDDNRLEKSLAYLGWQHIAAAVLDVYDENLRRDDAGTSTYKASADDWAKISFLRAEVLDRARRNWCERTKEDRTLFPYNEDCCATLYFKYRKRNDDDLAAFRRELAGDGEATLFD